MSFLDYNRKKTKLKLLSGERVHWIENNPRRDYIRQAVLSFPFWIKDADLRPMWDEAKAKEKITGVKHVLDHIVPINHPYVSGLSVPWNLQILTASQNSSKSNKFNPDQTDLIDMFGE